MRAQPPLPYSRGSAISSSVAPPGGMSGFFENPLLGGERRLQPSGVGPTRSGQPTPHPLHPPHPRLRVLRPLRG